MKKSDLIRMMKDYPDDAEVILWRWVESKKFTGSTYEILNPTLTSYMDSTRPEHRHPTYIALTPSRVFIEPDEAGNLKPANVTILIGGGHG
jgi:hypothetical protein